MINMLSMIMYIFHILDFTNMYGCLLNPTTLVGANYTDGHLYSANVLQGQVNWKKDKILFKICDGQIK